METIKVGTFNAKDQYLNPFYSGISKEDIDCAQILATYILENDLDILGTQELVRGYIKRLQTMLPNYKLVGNYRQGKEKFISIANETNSIITKHEILQTNTLFLPYKQKNIHDAIKYLMDTMPRILTYLLLEILNFGKIQLLNTHLAYSPTNIQAGQLKRLLLEISDKIKNPDPIILMGDFNMTMQNESFRYFIKDLSKLGISRIPNDKATHKNHQEPIDHMFISDSLHVEDIVVGDENLNQTSDHKVITIKLSRK